MIAGNKPPEIFSDRDPVAALATHKSDIVTAMREWNLGRVVDKETVHFCGLIHLPERGAFVFLPREARTGIAADDLAIASLTMRTLARFGAETSKREFESDGETGMLGTLAVIVRLVDDFKNHGLFSDRNRLLTKNSGKPDWPRTIKRETGIPDRIGRPVFVDVRTSRLTNYTDVLLARIQAAVIREISSAHSWWLPGISTRRAELARCPFPQFRRARWAKQLDALLPSLYSARSLFLAKYLRFYLRDTRASTDGTFVFGVSDFHTIWETVLRKTLVRSSNDTGRIWNSELPKPVYFRTDFLKNEARNRGMQIDIILENERDYTIVDAKYYSARSAETAPGWPDIAKQMFYENALREVVEGDSGTRAEIRNIFAFPSKNGNGPLASVEMRRADGKNANAVFPPILCSYISVRNALDCYVKGTAEVTFET